MHFAVLGQQQQYPNGISYTSSSIKGGGEELQAFTILRLFGTKFHLQANIQDYFDAFQKDLIVIKLQSAEWLHVSSIQQNELHSSFFYWASVLPIVRHNLHFATIFVRLRESSLQFCLL